MDMTDRWAEPDKQKQQQQKHKNHRGEIAPPPPPPVAPRLIVKENQISISTISEHLKYINIVEAQF